MGDGSDGLSELMNGSQAQAQPQSIGMLANKPGMIPVQPQTPQSLGLDSQAQNALGWQPLARK